MRPIILTVFVFICFSYVIYAQITDKFRNFPNDNVWLGYDSCFLYEDSLLILNAPKNEKECYISTYSTSIENSIWELSLQMNYNPSSSNFVRYFLVSDNSDFKNALNGYFLQIGGSTTA